jgi:hypothetical protein
MYMFYNVHAHQAMLRAEDYKGVYPIKQNDGNDWWITVGHQHIYLTESVWMVPGTIDPMEP